MPLRNPFRRNGASEASLPTTRSFSETSITSTQAVEPQQPVEYQLSEINDSGVFLPPPQEHRKPAFWHTKSASTISSAHRSILSDSEPFNMSRESFDSYRRSFDISARSPVASIREPDTTRRSLDSSLLLPSPRVSASERLKADSLEEEELEEVKLVDEEDAKQHVAPPKRRGLFSRFTEPNERQTELREPELGGRPSYSFQFFQGRKRGQSTQGDELRSMSEMTTPSISVGGE